MGGALHIDDFGAVNVAIWAILALSPWGAVEAATLDNPSHAGTTLGAATGEPGLACRNEVTPGVSAVTVHLEHTLVVIQYIARLADAALFAGGGAFGAGALTVAIQISTGRWTWGKAVCVAAVGRTLQSDFDTVIAAIIAALAVSPQGALESPALDSPSHAVAALGTVFVEPGLACRNEVTLGISAATLNSEHTLVIIQ